MPKSPTERINELERLATTLLERLDWVRDQAKTTTNNASKTDDLLQEVKLSIAVVEERLAELKRVVDENSRRRWAVVPSLIGAVLGGALAFAGQWIIRRYLPR